MFTGKVKCGEVWKTSGRKGNLTLRMLEDVDFQEDTFFQAEIVEGRARFASSAYRVAQALEGVGTPGTGLTFRTTLTTLHELVAEPYGEQKVPNVNFTSRIIG